MDTGYLEPGETIDNGFSAGQNLLPEEVLWIMDELICREAAWNRGRTLAQTLFTSVHIDHLLSRSWSSKKTPSFPPSDKVASDWTHLVLRAYCIGVIISSDITIELITAQTYYEEEDFNTNTYNRDLLKNFSDENTFKLLERAIFWVSDTCQGTKSYFYVSP